MSCPLFLTWLPRMATAVRPLGATGWRMAAGAVCLGALLAQVQTQAQTVRPGLWEFEGRHSQLRQSSGQTVDMQKINQQLETQLLGMEPGVRRMLEDNLRSVGVVVDRGRSQLLCVPPDQIQLARLVERQQQEGCTFTLQERGADFVRGQLKCTEPRGQGSHVASVITPERLSTRTELKIPQGQLIITTSAQWIAADCGNAADVGRQRQQERSLFGGGK